MKGTLYIVATPIGNLEDMSARAVRILGEADLIAAEDTRVSRVLLSHFKIKTPAYSCHKFNEESRGGFLVAALLEGKDVALITDAGTPCISDPGHRVVTMAVEAGVNVVPIPGASAVVAALSVSGFDVSRYTFLGFLPRGGEGALILSETLEKVETAVFYESPKRILKTLAGIVDALPSVRICLCNDLTKMFEKVYRGSAKDVLDELRDNPHSGKGEYVCVVNGKVRFSEIDEELPSIEARILDVMVKTRCTLKEAGRMVKEGDDGLRKKEVYAAMLRVKEIVGGVYL